MKNRIVKWAAGLSVAWGLLTPQLPVLADSPTPVNRVEVKNISLGPSGTLTGKVVDANGVGIEGAMVVVHLGNNIVAKTVTDAAGSYTVTNLRGGTYQITAGQTTGLFRLWTENTAPPSSFEQALIVSNPQVVRGQTFPGFNPGFFTNNNLLQLTTLGAAGAGLGMGVASYQKSKQAEENSAETLRIVQSQQSSPF